MKIKKNKKFWPILAVIVILFGGAMALNPSIQRRVVWEWIVAQAYLSGVINPVSAIPTANAIIVTDTPSVTIPTSEIPKITPTQEIQVTATVMPTPTNAPLPEKMILNSPAYEKQDINNCGPATLTMYLRFYGWEGDQFTVSDLIKPIAQDRNVNVEELDYYVKNYAGWLKTNYRVGGNLETIKKFIASGIPVMIEETFIFDESYWPNDDRWGGHYLLINGYDDQRQQFLSQDSFVGPDHWFDYQQVDKQWQAFNRVYILVYTPDQEATVKQILGDNWDPDTNRKNALEASLKETQEDPNNVFAWFNLGSNYVYFENYDLSTQAYDKAREIGWPQRMLRYQFSPFIAYFHALRTDDLMTLVNYALERTPNSEEALLWNGWGLYRNGDKVKAIESFQAALQAQPNYLDAEYALNYVMTN
ncbi:MAG: C39 family peptidase [Anaerolineaceae bacterium]